MTSKGRAVAILGVAILILAAAAGAFRFETQRKPRPPLIGVVHETEIRVAPEISARLASIKVKSGQEARKGEVLAALSSPETAAALEEAKASRGIGARQPRPCHGGRETGGGRRGGAEGRDRESQCRAGERAVRPRLGAGGEELRQPPAAMTRTPRRSRKRRRASLSPRRSWRRAKPGRQRSSRRSPSAKWRSRSRPSPKSRRSSPRPR